jgi:hypothetical protein
LFCGSSEADVTAESKRFFMDYPSALWNIKQDNKQATTTTTTTPNRDQQVSAPTQGMFQTTARTVPHTIFLANKGNLFSHRSDGCSAGGIGSSLKKNNRCSTSISLVARSMITYLSRDKEIALSAAVAAGIMTVKSPTTMKRKMIIRPKDDDDDDYTLTEIRPYTPHSPVSEHHHQEEAYGKNNNDSSKKRRRSMVRFTASPAAAYVPEGIIKTNNY